MNVKLAVEAENATEGQISTAAMSLQRLVANVGRAVVGKSNAIELLLVALICEGHVLLEDVPGVGKTLLAKALARSLGLSFRRVQFTPDLLPSDITGSRIFNQRTAEFEFRPGPIFAQIILADEVNRATPRTQSALLEAMEERQVTADGETMALKRPFLVLATQNPIELEGTFPLPEAQLDRFLLQVNLGYPTVEEEETILLRLQDGDRTQDLEPVLGSEDIVGLATVASRVHISDAVRTYLISVVRATRQRAGIALGGSPRATIALFRATRALACVRGRDYALPDDIKYLAPFILAHRLILTSEARVKGQTPRTLVSELLNTIPVPVEETGKPTAGTGG
ncbi:MAG TPA: MoxR family ATPase [Rhizomicrobium sp.]|jgi:MoxR-like ATPase|nr:MoxR family ATPase [Rhizomicrobium sp.]